MSGLKLFLARIPPISTDFYCDTRDTNDEIRIIAADEALSAINEAPLVAY
jgi:hypothetical protein